MKNKVELKDVYVKLNNKEILKDFNMSFSYDNFYTIVGPSGCGKTTILNLISGFLTPDSGKIEILGEDVTNVKPAKRHVNTIFQDYSLFEHLNVYENIAYGLNLKKHLSLYLMKK